MDEATAARSSAQSSANLRDAGRQSSIRRCSTSGGIDGRRGRLDFDGPGGPIEHHCRSSSSTARSTRSGCGSAALAYTPDLNGIPAGSLPFLEGLDLWIIDALRYKPHPSHFSLAEALALDRADASRGAPC